MPAGCFFRNGVNEPDDLRWRQVAKQFLGCLAVSEISEAYRRWGLERTLVRGCSGGHDHDVEDNTENSEGDDDAPDRRVDRPHGYRDRPHIWRRSAIWSMTGRLSIHRRKGHFWRPSNLRWRSPQRSIIDPPVCRRYRFSHCLPSIATNAASSDISRLAYRRFEVVTTSAGGPFHAGGAVGSSFGMTVRLRLRKIARR
jgi:hypothetical protein